MSDRRFGIVLAARVDQYVAAMATARAATSGFSAETEANLKRVGSSMVKVGRGMTTAVTLPLVALGGVAIKSSMDFERSFSQMEGLANIPAGEVEHLKESVKDLAKETGVSAQELADALYFASSAGLDTADAMDAVNVAARASASGMGSAQDVVGLVASALASYGAENIDAARATDILTATIRAGRAEPAELAGTLGRILPVAASLGVSFEEVGGATAYLSNIMGRTTSTVTSMSGILSKLIAPTEQGKQALTDMGTSFDELQQAISEKGLMGALELLREHGFGSNREALRALFDDVEAFRGAIALVEDKSGTLAATMGEVADSSGALGVAFAAVADDSGFRMRQAFETLRVALIDAGDVIVPLLATVAEKVAGLADWFSDLPAPVQAVVLAFAALAAAAGPLLMIAGSLIRNLQAVMTAVKLLGAAIAASPWIALAAVVAGAGFALWSFMNQTTGAEKAMARAKDTAEQLYDAISQSGPIEGLRTQITQFAEGSETFRRALIGAKLNIEDLVQAAATGGGGSAIIKFQRALIEGGVAAGLTSDEIKKLADELVFNLWTAVDDTIKKTGEMEVAQGRAATAAEGWQVAIGREKAALEQATPAIDDATTTTEEQAAALAQTNAQMDAYVEATKEAAKSALEYLKATTSEDWGKAALTGANEALTGYTESMFRLGNFVQSRAESFRALYQAVGDGALDFDTATEAGAKQQDALEGIARVLDTQFADAYTKAGGNLDAFKASARDIGEGALMELASQLGLNAEQVDTLRGALHLTEGDYEARFTLSGEAEARTKLGLLQGMLGSLPVSVQTEIQQKIIAGDWQGALNTLQANLASRPVSSIVVPVADQVAMAKTGKEIDGIGAKAREAEIRARQTGATEAGREIERVAGSSYPATIRTGEQGASQAGGWIRTIASQWYPATIRTGEVGAAESGGWIRAIASQWYPATIRTGEVGAAGAGGTIAGVAGRDYRATIDVTSSGGPGTESYINNIARPRTAMVNIVSRTLGGLVPGAATGTKSAPGGLMWVGEEGPELVNLPRGSQVYTAPESRAMMKAAQSATPVASAPSAPPAAGFSVGTIVAADFDDALRQMKREAWAARMGSAA